MLDESRIVYYRYGRKQETTSRKKAPMRKPQSVDALEKLGRVRLSKSFYMREFLYSEIANFYGIQNIPDDPDLAIEVGKKLCEELLEPLNATFGRVAIRSSFRSCSVNELGTHKHNCAENESNYARHIWDRRDAQGLTGATTCIAIPWFTDKYEQGADWQSLAYWIHDHLPYSEVEFFDGKGICIFNLSWHEAPKKTITSWMTPRVLLKNAHGQAGFEDWYKDFPKMRHCSEIYR
jgi:hypothetical protein